MIARLFHRDRQWHVAVGTEYESPLEMIPGDEEIERAKQAACARMLTAGYFPYWETWRQGENGDWLIEV